jgi:hypothetical protein
MHKNETPGRIHQRLLAFCGEDTVNVSSVHRWVINSRYTGRNLNLNDHLWSGRPVAATRNLNMQKFNEIIEESGRKSTLDLSEDPKEAERTDQSCLLGGGGS